MGRGEAPWDSCRQSFARVTAVRVPHIGALPPEIGKRPYFSTGIRTSLRRRNHGMIGGL